ncbi:arabinan endo-1,5-alpha-L-arabinosidase [Lewinella sp. IMCC34191]|uniref:arabinan endo-1,5-alpha-L-arabinosidase n=1 Tax=Lewinella sp. IMCC34191 TaxID=2259172 RepID=UPI000E281E34|nr:arabinan endo-1,5-alpha-L-arabinosidase [Lewinella sp. IMCC34191]
MSQSSFTILLLACLFVLGCQKDNEVTTPTTPPPSNPPPGPVVDTTSLDDGPIDFSVFSDTYGELASPDRTDDWMHYNVHDPVYWVDDDFTWCYNTDVAFGHAIRPGIQIRRSINLVEWEFVGWAFPGIPSRGANFIRSNGGEPVAGLWAPDIIKVDNEYRLYYSLASTASTPRLSVIGLATSDRPEGPFIEQDLVVTSLDDATRQTNAIDPSIVVAKDGSHWMYYGSAWDGIYRLELDPDTGLAKRNNDKGTRVAQRGFTGGRVNGNIEGPDIIYNPEFDQYYLFIAYDWLETKYNVRVGRSDNATGPFYDYLGRDMNEDVDDLPMLIAPYRFAGHGGWQGVSHPGVFEKNDTFYIGHQGRPDVNPYYMVMHLRQLFWTEDGWPLVSPQRYAAETESAVGEEEIAGDWEIIRFDYEVVPGYAEEQVDPGYVNAEEVRLAPDGTVSGALTGSWSYSAPRLTLTVDGSSWSARIERGRDWENEVAETVLFTGLQENGYAVWGKKTEP